MDSTEISDRASESVTLFLHLVIADVQAYVNEAMLSLTAVLLHPHLSRQLLQLPARSVFRSRAVR